MHKKQISFFFVTLTWVIVATMSFISCSVSNQTGKPNIILIFTDDQGYGDLGCYGSPNIFTPNIDKMAMEGMRFTSFYAAAVCGPSRAQLMTGCYHARVSHSFNELPGDKTGLNPNEITIAEVLKAEGYRTMHIGKWHLGDVAEFLPIQQGFDHFFGFPYSHDMEPYHYRTALTDLVDTAHLREVRERAEHLGYSAKGNWRFPPLPLYLDETVIEENPDQSQFTSRFTEKALQFIEQNSKQPFFLYLAHVMPHTPLAASDKFLGKSDRGLYGDALMEVDWSCGEILKKLKDLGIDQNTLVVFTSDNGPTPHYGTDGGSAGLLRGAKGSMYEGGLRVPAIFRWPKRIPAGRCSNVVASTIDLLPTFANIAGAIIPEDRIIEGKDIYPLLSSEIEKSLHEYFHYFGGCRPDDPANYKAIRNERWKLFVKRNQDGELKPTELYDPGTDPSEKYDRLSQFPDIANILLKEAHQFCSALEENRRSVGRIKINKK